jgi:hypothetical protein
LREFATERNLDSRGIIGCFYFLPSLFDAVNEKRAFILWHCTNVGDKLPNTIQKRDVHWSSSYKLLASRKRNQLRERY